MNSHLKFRRPVEDIDEGWMVSYADLITLLFIFFSLMLSMSSISKTKFELLSNQFNQSATTSLADLKKQVDAEIQKQQLQSQVKTDLTDEGLQVQFNEELLFGSGEAHLNTGGSDVLKTFTRILANIEQGFQLAIEGHTDSRPIHTKEFSSNWALSSARAVNVLHYFASQGIENKKMMVKAFADTRPVKGHESSYAQNRRVTILVY